MANRTQSKQVQPSKEFRFATITRADGDDERVIRLSFASETPVDRWYGREILSCREGDVDLSRLQDGGPLLKNHDPDELLGVVTEASVDADGVCRAVVKLSRNATSELADIQDGILTKASVGYETTDILEDTPADKDTGVDRTIRWAWRPYEISLVSIPADETVGIGRSLDEENAAQAGQEAAVQKQKEQERVKIMEDKNIDVDLAKARSEAASEARAAFGEIVALCNKYHKPELAEQALRDGLNKTQVLEQLMQSVSERTAKPAQPGAAEIGLNAKEREQYSIARAIQYAAGIIPASAAKLEIEASEAAQRKSNRALRGNITIPHDVLIHNKRAFTVAGTGSNLVATDLRVDSFIDVLRNRTLMGAVGAQFMTGLVGDVAIQKKTAASTAYWVAENADITTSDPVIGQVTGTPKTCGAFTDVSRKLLHQSALSIEALVRDDLTQTLAVAIDKAAISGAGTAEPVGLLDPSRSGVNNPSVSGTPTYTEILSFRGDIEADNAVIGDMRWVVDPLAWAKLAGTAVATNASKFILDADTGMCIGYQSIISNQVPTKTAILGVWSQIVIGMWGGLDINIDDKSLSKSGGLRIIAMQDVDVMIRHEQAFAFNSTIG